MHISEGACRVLTYMRLSGACMRSDNLLHLRQCKGHRCIECADHG